MFWPDGARAAASSSAYTVASGTVSGRKHRTERREAREVADEAREDAMQSLEAQQVDDLDRRSGHRMLDGEARQGGEPRHHHDEQREHGEQRGWMGQRIAAPFDGIQEPI